MKNIIPLLIGLLAVPVYAQVHKWIDASGKVLYSDRLQDGANAKEVPGQHSAPAAAATIENLHQRELDSRERRMQREAANQEAADAVVREKHHMNMNRRH